MGFLLEYLKNPRFIGAVAPSGINLSRRMIRPINFKTAKVIVEYGPGTGSFTRELVIHRNPGTALLLIERNPLFCDELKKLYEIMTDTDGIYGGRFSGAGFKGCCMALIDPDKAEDIEAKVTAEYLKAFPALDGKYSFHLCESADGVEL